LVGFLEIYPNNLDAPFFCCRDDDGGRTMGMGEKEEDGV